MTAIENWRDTSRDRIFFRLVRVIVCCGDVTCSWLDGSRLLASATRDISFDVTTSNISFLRGSNTQLRDVTAGPLSDVTPLQCTADPTPEPHGRTSSRGPSHSFLVVTSIATIGTFEATFFFFYFC